MIGNLLNDRYELIEELDREPAFKCYHGRDRTLNREVYLRIVDSKIQDESEFIAELRRVVGRNSEIKSGGVERFFGVEDDQGSTFVVSEFSPGSRLSTRLKRLASLSVPVAVATVIEICEALQPLHEAGVIHGDVSAQSVMTTSTDGVKVLTPGFWRAFAHSEFAAHQMLKGMAPYLAPEVTAGGMPTQLSDIYSIGILMWQILAGRTPYHGDSPVQIATKHASEPVPSVKTVVAAVPDALDHLIRKCMDKNPLKRYSSLGSLLNDLRQIQDALRFGKKLAWPITGEASVEELGRIAPDMNAIDSDPESEEKRVKKEEKVKKERKTRSEDGVPIWLSVIAYMMSIAFIIVIGGWMFFRASQPKSFAIPNFVGKNIEEARKEMREHNVTIKEVRREPSDDYEAGAIISTNPTSGEMIKENFYINAIVSSGSKFVELPDFRGRDIGEVKELIQSLDLRLTDQDIEYVQDRDSEPGMVLSQVPEPRKSVERKTTIKLKVSNGNERVSEGGRSNVSKNYNISVEVPALLDAAVLVRIEMTDDRGTKTVYEDNNNPGDTIEEESRGYGTEVIFRIFFDNELVKQITKTPGDD